MMKTFLFIVLITATNYSQAQIDSYTITKSDTIELSDISFKRVVALHLDAASVLVDYDIFMKHLTAERNGLNKQIRSRERMIKRGTGNPGIISSQLKSYQRQFNVIDSVFAIAKQTRLDTLHVDFTVFQKTNSPFGNFLPSVIENKQCIVLDLNNHKQNFVIKLSGTKKTGEMTAIGSSFYFIPGATKYFLSKMDWVS